MSVQSDLAELYTAFYNRAPDADGLAYWVSELNSGNMTLESIARNWEDAQPETQEKYPDSLSTEDFIEAVYGNVFSRSSDAEGAAYWKAGLEDGSLSRDSFIAAVLNGAKANTSTQGLADATLVNNKAQVGVAFAEKGLNDTALAAKVLTSVSANTDTLTATLDLIKLIPASTAAQTPALLALVSSTLDKVAALISGAPGELSDLATYLNAVVAGTGSTTNLTTLFTSINTKAGAALTNPSALDNPAAQAGSDVVVATPTTGTTTPVFAVTEVDGVFTVSTQNGNVHVTLGDGVLIFTPAVGTAVEVSLSLLGEGGGFVLNTIKLTASLDAFETLMSGIFSENLTLSGTGTLVYPEFDFGDSAPLAGLPVFLDMLNVRIDLSTITKFTGSASEFIALYARTDVTGLSKVAISIDDDFVSLAALKTIDGFTTGQVTYNGLSGTYTELMASSLVTSTMNVSVTDAFVTLTQLAALDNKADSVEFVGVSGSIESLLNSDYVTGGINVRPTDLPTTATGLDALAGKITGDISFDLTTVDDFYTLFNLNLASYWTADLVDTATNLLDLTQGETRNINIKLVSDAAGQLTVQERSDLAKILIYDLDSEWTFSFADTAKNLLASFQADPDLINEYASSVVVTGNTEVSIAELHTLQNFPTIDPTFNYTIVDTLSNLSSVDLGGDTYFVADTILNLESVSGPSALLLDNAYHNYVVDTVANIQQGASSSALMSANGYIVEDTFDALWDQVGTDLLEGALAYKVTELVDTSLSVDEALFLNNAANSNDYINAYTVFDSVAEASTNLVSEHSLKYASSVNLFATANTDKLNGDLTDGHITILYTSGTQADTFTANSGSFVTTDDNGFDAYSFLYGSPSIPDRDHIEVVVGSELTKSLTDTVTDSTYAFVKGSYDTNSGAFTKATNGTDTLVAWDSDSSTEVSAVAIVLVGQSPNNASEIVNFSLKLMP
jgi:hypothetical protein